MPALVVIPRSDQIKGRPKAAFKIKIQIRSGETERRTIFLAPVGQESDAEEA